MKMKRAKYSESLSMKLTPEHQPSEITREQKCIFGFLFLILSFIIYIFWISKLQETNFSALFIILIAFMLFVLLYRRIMRFSVSLKGVEFEMITEH